jgi:xylulokinase
VATGGANRSLDLLQVKADFFGAEVLFGEQMELGTFGAAMIAAVGCGWYDSLGAAQAAWVKIARRVIPKPGRHESYMEWISQRKTR